MLQQLRSHPQAGGLVGPDEWNDAFVGAAYYVYGWEDVATAFDAAVNQGDFAGIKDLYDASNGQGPGADNTYAVYNAVQCTDVRWPQSWAKWQRDNWRTYDKAPFLTWNNAWYNAPCLNWAGKPGTPVDVTGKKVPGILLISETNDAATPYAGSLEVRSLFPKSVLIEGVGGTTHAGSLSGVACTDDTIANYFATGALPARKPGRRSDLQCDPVPQPNPLGAQLRSATPQSGLSPELQALRSSCSRRFTDRQVSESGGPVTQRGPGPPAASARRDRPRTPRRATCSGRCRPGTMTAPGRPIADSSPSR